MKGGQTVQEAAEPVTEIPAPGSDSPIDPLQVLREVLELQRESNPDLEVEDTMAYAIANPEAEVVDSLGAVSVVCVSFGTYTPENLIPQNLLTHRNFSTLNGLRSVVSELTKRQGGQ